VSIGATLVQARLAAGLTTADVAEKTRIRRTLVEAIENDDFSHCGGDVYARGHLGTIARTVGLDPEPLLAEFDATHADSAPTVAEVFEAETSARPERRSPNWTTAMVGALVLVVGLGLWQLVSGPDTPRETTTGLTPTVSATPTVSVPSTPPAVSEAPAPTDSAVAEVPDDGVTVRITASGGRSWIAATEGTKQVFQGILEDGQSKTFSDDLKVKLVIGSAGAVKLKVNGQDLGSPGGNGQVVRLTFGPGDPTAAG
jgi:cytoskeletal protein RodZ